MKKLLFLLSLLISTQLNSQTYNGTGGSITDDGQPNYFTINVSGLSPTVLNATHGLVSVCLNITHTYDSDLNVKLIAPNQTEILLFSSIGGGDDNFTNTCLNDNAATSIAAGPAPFSGSFKPMDVLGNVNNGQNGNGIWKLKITDNAAQDAGTLLNWSITFGNNATTPLTVDSTVLPLVLIDTYGGTIVDEPKINAGMKIIYHGLGFYNHPTDVPNVYNGEVGIEIRGSFSAGLPQKPYGFETRDAFGENLDTALLGMPSENDWILLAVYNDKVFMRNALPFKLSRMMDRYAPRTRFCEVILNGSYQGIYVMTEKIKRDNDRVDISKLDLNDNAGDSLTGGYIVKLDYHDGSNSWLSDFHPYDHPALDVYYVYDYPDYDVITPQQKTYIQGFMHSLEAALYSSNFTNPTTGYRTWLDVDSFIDYLILSEVSRNNDGFKKSVYMYKDKNSKNPLLQTGPLWDIDWAWKNINECSIFAATDGSGWAYKVNDCNPDNNSSGWAVRMMQDTAFTHQLNCRYFNLRRTILDTTYLFHYIDSVHTLVNEAQVRHYKKWPILGINVGTPEVDYQPTTYAGEIQKFKNWIKLRLNWLDDSIPGYCPNVGFSEIAKDPILLIFPNPTQDYLYIELDAPIKSTEVYDLEGQLLIRSNEQTTRKTLDLSGLCKGLYLLRITSNNDLITVRKIVKQ
jgi:subtilisin-like proprotein convertase family protein